jgi:hypothetical protein
MEDEPRFGCLRETDRTEPIAELLYEKPFTSCKSICRRFQIPKRACRRVLHQELGLTSFYLRWVPHTLDANQMSERITVSHHLPQVLELDEQQNFRNLVTADESWFLLETSVTSGRSQSRHNLPSQPRQQFQTEKCLLLVIWSPDGLHSILTVRKRILHFNNLYQYCCSRFATMALLRNAVEDGEVLENVSRQRERSQFEALSRNIRRNWLHEVAASCVSPRHRAE